MSDNEAPPLRAWMSLPRVYHDVADVIGWDNAVNFGMKVWETKRPPSKSKTDSVHGGGRGCIYIPKALTRYAGGELVALAGRIDAELLVAALGGCQLEFPCIVTASIARRNRVIAQQYADGLRAEDIAFGFDLSARRVRQIIRQESSQHGS